MNRKISSIIIILISALLVLSACEYDMSETAGSSTFDEIAVNRNESVYGEVAMPNSLDDYLELNWTIEEFTQHLEDLGFTNIRSVACESDDDNYKSNIFEVSIEDGWSSVESWEVGDSFESDAEISVFYNETPMLTIENCPDLKTVLTSRDMETDDFCEKYDGRYVEFNAFVTSHETYDGGASHTINVSGGDYDNTISVDEFDPSVTNGAVIRIGDRTWDNSIDQSVSIGDNVYVSGKIDSSWADYYNCIYIEALLLEKR